MSYENMDSVPTQTSGVSEILADDWNTYVRDNFDSIKSGHIVCTSSTRPTGIQEGTMVYETDTQKVLVYSGASWVEISDIDRAGGLPETSPGHLIVANDTAKAALTAIEGMMVYQSDNNKVFVYSGSVWVEISDLDNVGAVSDNTPRLLDYKSLSGVYTHGSSASGASNMFASNLSFTADGTSKYRITLMGARYKGLSSSGGLVGDSTLAVINGTNLYNTFITYFTTDTGSNPEYVCYQTYFVFPAGVNTINFRGYTYAIFGSVSSYGSFGGTGGWSATAGSVAYPFGMATVEGPFV